MATALRTEEQIREFEQKFVDDVWNGDDFGFIEETHGEDYVGHWFDLDGDVDRDGLEAFIREVHAGFSNFEMTVEFAVVEGDMGVTGFTAGGTHDGEFMGIPATGKVGSTPGIMVHRFEDGEVVEAWAVWDALGQLQQLGVLPKSFTLASFLETGANLAKQDVLKLAKGA
ncbi:MAG: ester cyclase [Haloferacaceae archaeon]